MARTKPGSLLVLAMRGVRVVSHQWLLKTAAAWLQLPEVPRTVGSLPRIGRENVTDDRDGIGASLILSCVAPR